MVVREKEIAELRRLCAEFFNRLNADTEFAMKFDKDPAAALQELFPHLAKAPKKNITNTLEAYRKSMDAAITSPEAKKAGINAAFVLAILAAAAAAAAVVAYLVHKYLKVAVEPQPE